MPTHNDETKRRPSEATDTDWDAVKSLTDDEREAAARSDPDAPPLAPGRRMYRMAISKRLRIRLGLSEAEFAERYRISLSMLQDWERHKAVPDAMAQAYLAAIAADPDGVASAAASIKADAAE